MSDPDLPKQLDTVEQLIERHLEKRRGEIQRLLGRVAAAAEKDGPEQIKEDLKMLDEIVAQSPGTRIEHIEAQAQLKNIQEKISAEHDDVNSDSDTE